MASTKIQEAALAFRYEVSEGDRQVVRRIVESTGFFRVDEVDVAVELVDERLAKGDASGYHFVFAEAEGRPIGYVCYGPIACTVGSYDLYWIAVHPSHQGRGVGQALLVEIERSIAEAGARWLLAETSSSSIYDKTRAFYERACFAVVGNVPDFYRPQDGRITFGKRLT